MDMTVRQISDELGVSRQRIYRYIRTSRPKYHYVGSGKTMYFSGDEVAKMKRAFLAESGDITDESQTDGKTSEDEDLHKKIAELEKKLEAAGLESSAKDRRIEELTEQRRSLLTSLGRSTECIKELSSGMRNLTDSLRAAQVMQAETLRRLDEERSGKRFLIGREAAVSAAGELIAKLLTHIVRR